MGAVGIHVSLQVSVSPMFSPRIPMGIRGSTRVSTCNPVVPRGCHLSPPCRIMSLGLPLLLLVLTLQRVQGGVGPPPGPPPGSPELTCGAAALEAVLGRLRELEGEVRALQGQCGDNGGPQAGTGMGIGIGRVGGYGRHMEVWGGHGRVWGT